MTALARLQKYRPYQLKNQFHHWISNSAAAPLHGGQCQDRQGVVLSKSNCDPPPLTPPLILHVCLEPGLHLPFPEARYAMQRLQDDPLQRTIETVMPLDQLNEDDKVLHVPSFVPATVDKVCGIISRQPGIDAFAPWPPGASCPPQHLYWYLKGFLFCWSRRKR